MTENLRKLEGNKSQVTSLKRVYVSKILKKLFLLSSFKVREDVREIVTKNLIWKICGYEMCSQSLKVKCQNTTNRLF